MHLDRIVADSRVIVERNGEIEKITRRQHEESRECTKLKVSSWRRMVDFLAVSRDQARVS